MKLTPFLGTFFAVAVFILTGCGAEDQDNNKHQIKVGVMAGAEAQIAEVAAKIAKEKYDLDVKLIPFTDYVTPNAALDDGSIDVNTFQHKPYLEQQMSTRNYQLAIAGNTFVYPIAGYSKTITSIEQLKDGDRIAIPNDPTNLGRSLILLSQQKLITLRDDVGLLATLKDIKSNPKNLEIIELDSPQLPRSLDDVELAIINTTYASTINLTPQKDGIFVEDKDSPYVNLIVSRKNNVNTDNVVQFVKSFQTEEVYQSALKTFHGGVIKGWE